jgi:Zn-dependent protease with chaperone function
MTELRALRRIESALAAYATAMALLVLATGADAIRFHLPAALAGDRWSAQDAGVIALAAADLAIVAVFAASAALQVVRSRTFRRRLCVRCIRRVGGHTVVVVDDRVPRAFCAGLLRPRVHVSSAALRILAADELAAVVAHERHHARRFDPLRLVLVRALVAALPWAPGLRRLGERHTTVAELAADAAAVRAGGSRRPLAAALVALAGRGGPGGRGIAPERVDQLMGRLPRRGAPDWMLASAGLSLALLALAVVAGVLPGGRDVCSAVAGAPAALAGAAAALVVLAPIWLVARSAEAAVRIPD